MKRLALASATTLLGAGLLASTSAMAWDHDDGYRRGFRTTVQEYDVGGPPPPRYGYRGDGFRGVGFGDVAPEPRYRSRRITREVIEYDNDDDVDD